MIEALITKANVRKAGCDCSILTRWPMAGTGRPCHRRTVRLIESALKASGELPLTEKEQLEKDLDAAFPNAESKQTVEFRGRTYQLKFWPVEKSRSGKKVIDWGRGWVEVI